MRVLLKINQSINQGRNGSLSALYTYAVYRPISVQQSSENSPIHPCTDVEQNQELDCSNSIYNSLNSVNNASQHCCRQKNCIHKSTYHEQQLVCCV